MQSEYKSSNAGTELEKLVLQRFRQLGYRRIEIQPRVPDSPDIKPDLYAVDNEGKAYFIEVKAHKVHRLDLGQLIEYAARISKTRQNAKVGLICKSVQPEVRDFLQKTGISVWTLEELGIRIPFEPGREKKPLDFSPREQEAYFALERKGVPLVTYDILASAISVSHIRAKNLLVALAKGGAAVRVGRGKYVMIPPDVLYRRRSYTADPLVILEPLLSGAPYFVAYASAANLHGLATQLPFDTFVVLQHQKRALNLGPNRIMFIKNSPSRFFAIESRTHFDSLIKVSAVEKTLLDCLERPYHCGGFEETVRILFESFHRIDWSKMEDYIPLMENRALAQRLGYLLEKRGGVPKSIFKTLRKLMSPYFYPLDLSRPKLGPKCDNWRIVENARLPR